MRRDYTIFYSIVEFYYMRIAVSYNSCSGNRGIKSDNSCPKKWLNPISIL